MPFTQIFLHSLTGQEVLSFLYFYEILFISEKPSFWTKIMLRGVRDVLISSQELLFEVLTESTEEKPEKL